MHYTKITDQHFHGERDIILAVRDFIRMQGYASFEMIQNYLPTVIKKMAGDDVYLKNTGMVRLHKIIQNLQNHQTLEMLSTDNIMSVRAHDTGYRAGFVTREYAERHHVPVLRMRVFKPMTMEGTARHRVELDNAIADALYDSHVDMGEPEYDVDAIELRMEVLAVFENDPALSILAAKDVAENVLIKHMVE